MATVATPEESARRILSFFMQFRRRPGEVLRYQNFLATWFEPGWEAAEFNAGRDYAVEHGWVTVEDRGTVLRLTEAAFAEA